MAIDMTGSKEILRKIRTALRTPKTTLEVNGNNGSQINFEKVQGSVIDEMYGDQLFGHPAMKEMEDLRESGKK